MIVLQIIGKKKKKRHLKVPLALLSDEVIGTWWWLKRGVLPHFWRFPPAEIKWKACKCGLFVPNRVLKIGSLRKIGI